MLQSVQLVSASDLGAQLQMIFDESWTYLKLLTSHIMYSTFACGPATALISSRHLYVHAHALDIKDQESQAPYADG